MMREDGMPMIANFGLGRLATDITSLDISSERASYRWIAPELLAGVETQDNVLVTTASDVWGFGCLCIEVWSMCHY
jgi:serine/threonine protein kinase